jgi:hypothetical protein
MILPLGMRLLLGVFEAGLFPGVNYYLSWCAPVVVLGPKLSLHLVGTNVQNSASARQYSTQRPLCRVRSVVCLLYVHPRLLVDFY